MNYEQIKEYLGDDVRDPDTKYIAQTGQLLLECVRHQRAEPHERELDVEQFDMCLDRLLFRVGVVSGLALRTLNGAR